MQKNIEKIKKTLKSKFYFDYEIYKHTWFKTGGKAYIFCLVYDEKELEIILNNTQDLKKILAPYFKDKNIIIFMGAGSITYYAENLINNNNAKKH